MGAVPPSHLRLSGQLIEKVVPPSIGTLKEPATGLFVAVMVPVVTSEAVVELLDLQHNIFTLVPVAP